MVVTSKSGADWPTRLPVGGDGGAGVLVGGTGVSVCGAAVGGIGVGGTAVGVRGGGVVAGWASVLAAAVGVASSVPLPLTVGSMSVASETDVGVGGTGADVLMGLV